MTDLQTLLELSTDGIESPDLARTALATARHRRTRRRGAVAGLAAGVAVAGAVLVPRLVDDGSVVHRPTEQPTTPTPPNPTMTVSVDAEAAITQPVWDPRAADDLQPAAEDVAAALPDLIEPPTFAPALSDDPIDAAVVAFATEDALKLLSTDGSWRSVPLPRRGGGADLSRDGTRLLIETEAGVDVWDLADGTSRSVPLPDGYVDWDYLRWVWLDHETLLLDDGKGGWLVDAESGEVRERVGYPAQIAYYWAIDESGAVVETTGYEHPPTLADWAGGSARRVDMTALGTIGPLAANSDTIVATGAGNRQFSVLVAHRSDLTLRAILPLRDHDGNYSNGGLSVVGLLDDGTVLMRVTEFLGRGDFSLRLVAWNPDDATIALVSRTSENPGGLMSIAVDTLG
jgi:hypothetical protein